MFVGAMRQCCQQCWRGDTAHLLHLQDACSRPDTFRMCTKVQPAEQTTTAGPGVLATGLRCFRQYVCQHHLFHVLLVLSQVTHDSVLQKDLYDKLLVDSSVLKTQHDAMETAARLHKEQADKAAEGMSKMAIDMSQVCESPNSTLGTGAAVCISCWTGQDTHGREWLSHALGNLLQSDLLTSCVCVCSCHATYRCRSSCSASASTSLRCAMSTSSCCGSRRCCMRSCSWRWATTSQRPSLMQVCVQGPDVQPEAVVFSSMCCPAS